MIDRSVRSLVDSVISSVDLPVPKTNLVISVMLEGRSETLGFGQRSLSQEESPKGDTIYGVGSVTKVFTSSLLSILVAEGIVDINQPVSDLLPVLAEFPREITLQRLATHTSGLPIMPANIWKSMRKDTQNPYAAYSKEDLMSFLEQYAKKLGGVNSFQIIYSNTGMALLGEALASKLDVSYECAIIRRICEPLGMLDTRIQLSPEQEVRLALPHTPKGRVTSRWDMPAFAGAGALYSTANDLVKFISANLGFMPSPISAALQSCHSIQPGVFPEPGLIPRMVARLLGKGKDLSSRELNMALGWHVGRLDTLDMPVIWRHGASSGYRAMVIFTLHPPVGVVVLANTGPSRQDLLRRSTSTDDLGFKLLERLHTPE